MPTTMDKTQRYILLALPIVFLFFVANFPAGLVIYWVTTNLWTVGQGLVTRGLRKPPPPPPKRSSRTPPAAETRKQEDGKPAPAAAGHREPASPGQEEEEARRPMSAPPLQVETTGETVGEAKWAALRELERLHPGLDKSAVRFQVVSEGERGLLGVGYAPARVIASLDERALSRSRRPTTRGRPARSSRPSSTRSACAVESTFATTARR